MTIERVRLGQARMVMPGIACDQRGVAMGSHLLLLFSSLDMVVKWLAMASGAPGFAEVSGALQVERANAELGQSGFLVRLPARTSGASDPLAKMARMMSGRAFVGGPQQFVRFRDGASATGYDATEVVAGEGLVLYDHSGAQRWTVERGISLLDILTQTPLFIARRPINDESFVLAVPLGLAPAVQRTLWRRGVPASVQQVVSASSSYWLYHCARLPTSLLQLFSQVPGVGVFAMHGERAAVRVGWEHPFALEAFEHCFPPAEFVLFWGHARVERIEQSVAPTPIERTMLPPASPRDVVSARTITHVEGVPPRLVAAPTRRPIQGRYVPRASLPALRAAAYLLPPPVVAVASALTDQGAILLGAEAAAIPVGRGLVTGGPHVWIEEGFTVVPPAEPSALARALGATPERLVIWLADAPPVAFARKHFVPLASYLLTPIAVHDERIVDPPTAETTTSVVVNDELGGFALWGIRPTGTPHGA